MKFIPTATVLEQPICGRCPRCHPGRQFGGDTYCRALTSIYIGDTCTCHRKATT